MSPFDTIGQTYDDTRQADERIVSLLVEFLTLQPGATIADIGAGTGNYSVALAEEGFGVRAVEPSSVMRSSARRHPRVEWLEGSAENVPLPDASVDGVVSTLAICHFSDPQKAIGEMARISSTGSVVIFTFDTDAGKRTWPDGAGGGPHTGLGEGVRSPLGPPPRAVRSLHLPAAMPGSRHSDRHWRTPETYPRMLYGRCKPEETHAGVPVVSGRMAERCRADSRGR